MRKAQTEILGLAIVVVLVIIALALVVKFGFRQTSDIRNEFAESQEASNFLNAFLRTSADGCSGLTMTELLQNCAQGNDIICGNGEYSCEFVRSAAGTIFSKTFDAEKRKYEFLACGNFNLKEIKCYDPQPLVKIGQSCPAQKKLKVFPIPVNTGTIYTKLEVCS